MYFEKYKKYHSKLQNLMGGVFNEENYPYSSVTDININDIKYLNGVFSFTTMTSHKLKTNIIMLGDIHVHSENGFINETSEAAYCPDYLENIFKKYQNLNFDLLIELPYNIEKTAIEMVPGFIENTKRKFIECFRNLSEKSICQQEYPNTRFHAINIRHWGTPVNQADIEPKYNNKLQNFIYQLSSVGEDIQNVYQLLNKHTDKIDKKMFIAACELILADTEFIIDFMGKNQASMNFKSMINNNYKTNRYQHIPNYKIIDEYVNTMLNIISEKYNIGEIYLNFLDTFLFVVDSQESKIDVSNLSIVKKYVDKVENLCHQVNVQIFDYYMITRFMKIISYEQTENKWQNIILVAGNNHCQTLQNFILSNSNFFRMELQYSDDSFRNEILLQKEMIDDMNKLINLFTKYGIRSIQKIDNKFIYQNEIMLYFSSSLVDIITHETDKEIVEEIKNNSKYQTLIQKISSYNSTFIQFYNLTILYLRELNKNPRGKFVEIDDKIINLLNNQ